MIKTFEDLKCWQEARRCVVMVYKLTCNQKIEKEYDLIRQLKRASISIMNNIAEGFSRYHSNEFIRFLDFAKGSASEVLSMLYIIEDLRFAEKDEIYEIREQAIKTRKLILGLMRYLNKTSQ